MINYTKLATEFLYKCKEDSVFEKAKRLGTGCERIAYEITEALVLKVRKDIFIPTEESECYWDDRYDWSDEEQTEREIKIWEELSPEEKKLFNPILFHGEFMGYTFTICPKVEIAGDDYEDLDEFLYGIGDHSFDLSLLQDISDRYELDAYDMVSNVQNFGKNKDGKAVITDFGLLTF